MDGTRETLVCFYIPEWRALASVAIALSMVGFAAPALAGDIADCNQAVPDLRIRGCTRFIASGAIGSNLAIAHVNRGIAYDANNDTDMAIADFNEAIKIKPDLAIAYYNRGIAFSQIGALDRALADFNQAIRLDPDDPDAYDSRGFTFADLRDFNSAIADFTKAIELDPDFAAAYYHRGIAYGSVGDLDRGIADYNRALRLGCLRHGWCPAR